MTTWKLRGAGRSSAHMGALASDKVVAAPSMQRREGQANPQWTVDERFREDAHVTPANAALDGSPAGERRNAAIAMIDEGNTLEEQGRIVDAMARYDAAVRTDPRCARAHLNRGNILLAGAQFDAARSAYQLAIDCDPHYAAAHFNLGNLN